MATKILTLEEVAHLMTYKGVPLTVQAVRYRVLKSNRSGNKFVFRKTMSPRRRLVDGLAQHEVTQLCKLWKNLHV